MNQEKPMAGTYTYTTYEAEARGDDCADQMHAQGWTLREKTPEGIHGGMRYLWVRPGTPSTVSGFREFALPLHTSPRTDPPIAASTVRQDKPRSWLAKLLAWFGGE